MSSPQQYRAEQAAAAAAVITAAATSAALAGATLSNFTVFMKWVRMLFPLVVQGRSRAAWSARNFYDAERLRRTGLPRMDVPLIPDYQFDWLARDLRPVYDVAVRRLAVERVAERRGVPVPPARIEPVVRTVIAKAVADGGRDQMIAQAETDVLIPSLRESHKEAEKAKAKLRKMWGGNWVDDLTPQDLDADRPDVVGWARVATGQETCAWCLMLVSRGPVYLDADTAGAKYTSTEAANALKAGVVVPMNEWHTGCDCEVMAVFNKDDWPGKAAADKALEQWNDASQHFTYDPEKKYKVKVPDKADPSKYTYRDVTLGPGEARYRETLNNLRFILDGRNPADRQRVSKDQLDEILRSVPGAAKLFAKELARR